MSVPGWEGYMETALTVLEPTALPAELTAPLKLAADFAKASKAPATQAARDFRITGHRCGAVWLPGRRGGRWKAGQHARAPPGRNPVFPPHRWLRHAHRR
jgi:hypothetical protein